MSNNNNPSGLTAALAALYGNFGLSSNAMVAQASVAPFTQRPTPGQVLPARRSSSPFDIHSIYAQQVEQLVSAQQVAVQQRQLKQAQSPAALLSSLPPNPLQAYLAAMTSLQPPSFSGIDPFLGSNAMSYQQASQQQQQQINAEAEEIAAQILASSTNHSNTGMGTQHLSHTPTNGSAPMLQQGIFAGNLIGSMAKEGPTSSLDRAGTSPASDLLNHLQATAKSISNTSPSSDLSATSVAIIAPPAVNASCSSSSPSASAFVGKKASSSSDQSHQTPNAVIAEWEDKKLAKRAANRLSAHLSRKRKKMFIDDLTAENSDLRRKVQILQTIPDLIVVFDSSGCISFISQSVSTLLDMTNQDLEGTSFWNCLAEDSVKLIKSAFMDALAEKRKLDDDPTPLSHGESMLVKLVDKNTRETRAVSLKGVVHCTGVAPECVCSIRPIEAGASINRNGSEYESHDQNVKTVTGDRRFHNVSNGRSVKKRKLPNEHFSS
ncbi:hypothetical protein ACHAW6_001928 [Cyclotella cf. meneghiniana]